MTQERKRLIIKGVRDEYPPAGRCIYCGSAGPDLRREHALAFALGDDYGVLPTASCRCCEKITGGLEQTCLRTMFGPARAHLGFPTRNPEAGF